MALPPVEQVIPPKEPIPDIRGKYQDTALLMYRGALDNANTKLDHAKQNYLTIYNKGK